MKWQTKYRDVERFHTCVGSPESPVYSPKVNEDGTIDLIQTGVINIYDEIQSHADSCDINEIMKRFELGDTSVLERVNGFYGDFLDSPKTLAQVYQLMLDSRNEFDKLPTEVKNAFNNNPDEFICSLGSEKYYDVMNRFSKSGVQKEVTNNEESEQ